MKQLLIFSLAIAIASISRAQENKLNIASQTSCIIDGGLSTSSMGKLTPAYGGFIQLSSSYYRKKAPNLNTGMKITWGRIDLMVQDGKGAFRLNSLQVGYVAEFDQNKSGQSWELGFSAGPSITFNSDPFGRTRIFQFFTKIPGVNLTPEFRYNLNRLHFSTSYDFNFGIMLNNSAPYQQHTLRVGIGLVIPKK